jgi:hypothetical protein
MIERILKISILIFLSLMLVGWLVDRQMKKSWIDSKSIKQQSAQTEKTKKIEEIDYSLVPMGLNHPEYVKSNTSKSSDEYRKLAIFIAPICGFSSEKICIESNNLKNTLPKNTDLIIEAQLFAGYSQENDYEHEINITLEINSSSSINFSVYEVLDINGTSFKYRRSPSTVKCNPKCITNESGSIKLSMPYLDSHLKTGIDMIISGRHGNEQNIFLSPGYIQGFVDTLPIERFK